MPKNALDGGGFSEKLLNFALGMSLEWGDDWLCPINERMLAAHPQLAPAEAETLNGWCAAVREFVFAEVYP